jgi:hypothetical protein
VHDNPISTIVILSTTHDIETKDLKNARNPIYNALTGRPLEVIHADMEIKSKNQLSCYDLCTEMVEIKNLSNCRIFDGRLLHSIFHYAQTPLWRAPDIINIHMQ